MIFIMANKITLTKLNSVFLNQVIDIIIIQYSIIQI